MSAIIPLLLAAAWLAAGDVVDLPGPSADPEGIPPGRTPHSVRFQLVFVGRGPAPGKITLEEVDSRGTKIRTVGELYDDGKAPDGDKGDGVYTGGFSITARKEGKIFFRVLAQIDGRVQTSPPAPVFVTRFPVGLARSNPRAIASDPRTGEKMYSDELLVGFVQGTPPERIAQIMAANRMQIVGSIPHLGTYQVRIKGNGTVSGVRAAIATLKSNKEVDYAEPNTVTQVPGGTLS